MDPNAKQQIIDRLHEATNVLVTVSANPSVDQLAACIGFTIWLNKLGKHATAVFSGKVPSTLEFLQPEETLEKNTDSLRDFIIALDKSKADKLRYKVEDKVVKIFITPYRTSLSQEDLQFSQGDFNVEVVLGLGVQEREGLDQAIIAHGRILHDATVISVNTVSQGNIGSINWVDPAASSLSEMMLLVGKALSPEPLDNQIATAFMTGIVAETERFSNDRTNPHTMQLASELMSAGANQQLIATQLEKNKADSPDKKDDKAKSQTPSTEPDDALKVHHDEPQKPAGPKNNQPPKQSNQPPAKNNNNANKSNKRPGGSMVLEPPRLGGKLTANSVPEHLRLDPSTDPLTQGANQGMIINRSAPPPRNQTPFTLPPLNDSANATLPPVNSPKPNPGVINTSPSSADQTHGDQATADAARQAVDAAIATAGTPLEPVEASGAQPLELEKTMPPASVEPAFKFEETPVKKPDTSGSGKPIPVTDPSVTNTPKNAPNSAPFVSPTDTTTKNLPPPPPLPPPLMPSLSGKAK